MLALRIIRNLHVRNELVIYNQLRLSSMVKNQLASPEETEAKTEHSNKFYDIVICGGGIVGTSMASALGTIFKI